MSLTYSQEALNARPAFFNKIIVYVEGQDDIPFWKDCFKRCGITCEIEDVGGTQIKKYMENIFHYSCNYIVAADRDYSHFLCEMIAHDQIIITPCYSIENIIFSKHALIEFIESRSFLKEKERKKLISKLEAEMEKFKKNFIDFLYLDVINAIYERKLSILSNSYLNTNALSPEKKQEFKANFSTEEHERHKKIMEILENNFFFEVRGHFLEGWACDIIRNFVKSYDHNIHIDNDSIRIALKRCECEECVFFSNFIKEIRDKCEKFSIVKDSIERQKRMNN